MMGKPIHIVERIGKPSPLIVHPSMIERGQSFGDINEAYAYIDGVEYYSGHIPQNTKSEAVEIAQNYIDSRSASRQSKEFQERAIEIINVALNIDGSPPSALIVYRRGKYEVLTDDTIGNYRRQQRLLKEWRESLRTGDPEKFQDTYWGGIMEVRHRNLKGLPLDIPPEVVDIMSRAGLTARTDEEDLTELIGEIFSRTNELREQADLPPIEPPVRPLVSGDVIPAKVGLTRRHPVRVRKHWRRT